MIQSSSKDQDNLRGRGAAGRGSRGRGRGRGGRNNQKSKKNYNNEKKFQEDSEVNEFKFKHETLVANRGPKQAQEMHTACKNYCNTVMMPNMYQTTDAMKKKVQSEFFDTKIDPAKCVDANGNVNETPKTMGTMQAKEELSIQLKK